ncbi:MAG: hypothetical protein NC221_06090 [Duncaniella sp.]|nr:hypothetical protein [Muribaculum sp.]MCM1255669.1 hypothetical protein [Duncaniella sp.]
MGRYDDIINLPHHVSTTRKPMSMESRAAQFAPFAALTGHGDAINETARLTSERIELSPDEQRELSMQLNFLIENMSLHPMVTFTLFQADPLKSGGKYVRITGVIKKYVEYDNIVVLLDNQTIRIADIVAIDCELPGQILMYP